MPYVSINLDSGALRCGRLFGKLSTALFICVIVLAAADRIAAQQATSGNSEAAVTTPSDNAGDSRQAERSTDRQAELEAALVEMLSGATLEGSFTSTGPGRDPTKLSKEKYTLGTVKKLAGNFWLIPARIQYGEHDVTLPITLPIEWAGDTPLIVIDNIPLPGFGTVSARVMFFADHYAGYWKHGDHGGHLFGVIRRGGDALQNGTAASKKETSVGEPSAAEEPEN